MQPGTNFHAQSTGHDEYRLKFTCKRPENRSLRRLTTEGGDAVAGIDGRFSRPVIVGIKSSTGANLGGRTHGHMAAEEQAAKQEPPVAPEGRGSDRGGCVFKFCNLKAFARNPSGAHN